MTIGWRLARKLLRTQFLTHHADLVASRFLNTFPGDRFEVYLQTEGKLRSIENLTMVAEFTLNPRTKQQKLTVFNRSLQKFVEERDLKLASDRVEVRSDQGDASYGHIARASAVNKLRNPRDSRPNELKNARAHILKQFGSQDSLASLRILELPDDQDQVGQADF
jgi:hypothetical protein